MDAQTIEAIVNLIEPDETLAVESNLGRRLNVIDLLNFLSNHPRENFSDKAYKRADERLQTFIDRLVSINTAVYERLRQQIREKRSTSAQLRLEFDKFTDYRPGQSAPDRAGTDDLDSLLDGVLEMQNYSLLADPLPPHMIAYVPTPARFVLEAIDGLDLKPDDVFYDLGSGMGRVVMLANLIGGVRAKGIEISPVLHGHASAMADKLALSNVTFVNRDARQADFADGNVFYMYTPFTGDVLRAVLDQLQAHAQTRPLRLCSYGPNTISLADEPWLQTNAEDIYNMFGPVVFRSRQG